MQGLKENITITFWGVRGSIPTPGKNFLKYGGNTPCVEVRLDEKIFIFDAGTGIKNLGEKLIKEAGSNEMTLYLFISHTHWDHIQGFPFFTPIYLNNFTINIYGGHAYSGIEDLLRGQMKREYFPVLMDELASKLNFHNVDENMINIDGVKVYYTHLLHPVLALGFRIMYGDKVIVYATDNELIKNDEYFKDYNKENIGNLIKDADILIAECQYTDDEYSKKVGWGHSTAEEVIKISIEYNVKKIYMFHHDPYHDDTMIDSIVKNCKKLSGQSLDINAACEGLTITL